MFSVSCKSSEPKDYPNRPPFIVIATNKAQHEPYKVPSHLQLKLNMPRITMTISLAHASSDDVHEMEKTSTSAQKTLKMKSDVFKSAGGEAALDLVLQGLQQDGFWKGKFYAEKNLRLLRSFLYIRRTSANQDRVGTNLYIRITLEDMDWWIRHGPVMKHDVQDRRNRQVSLKYAQLEFFVDSTMPDRSDAKWIDKYEQGAARLGLNPWSGALIDRIVTQANTTTNAGQAAQGQVTKTNLDPEHLRLATQQIVFQARSLLDTYNMTLVAGSLVTERTMRNPSTRSEKTTKEEIAKSYDKPKVQTSITSFGAPLNSGKLKNTAGGTKRGRDDGGKGPNVVHSRKRVKRTSHT